MSKKNIVILVVVLLGIGLLLLQRDKEVDWEQSYLENGKKPFDTKVFNDQLKYWFPDVENTTKKLYTTFYEYSYDGNLLDSLYEPKSYNYIHISNSFQIDDESLNELLWFVANGNKAFIASDYFSSHLLDTLGLEQDYFNATIKEQFYKTYTSFTADTLEFTSKRMYGTSFFKDTTNVTTLGKIKPLDENVKTNFVKIPFVNGEFYLHSSPEVFTNYQMLKAQQTDYINAAISYLPKEEPLLQQMNAAFSEEKISNSPLRFVLSKPPLKWAWYLLLFTLGLFMIFNAKRRQRIIPIIEPLKNTTTEFVHSVSTIHYEARDFDGIIKKKIQYFLEHVRSMYYLKTDKLNADFIEKLALKAGKPHEEVEQLITLIIKMKSHSNGTVVTLTNLNKKLEKFYQK